MTEVPDQAIKAITKNLLDFGYSGLTEDFVREKVDDLIEHPNEDARPKDVISMFARTMLIEAGYLSDES